MHVAQGRVGTQPIAWGRLIVATILTAGTIALVWLVAVPLGPIVCAAVEPPMSNCIETNREGSALVMTVVIGALYLVTVLVALLKRRPPGILHACIVTLALAPIVSYLVVVWAPGFPIASL